MSNKISATIEIKRWEEEPFDEGAGIAKLTRASVEKVYSGDITGTSATESLMAYAPDETASFVGIDRIKGTVWGMTGTLVLQHVGTFEDGVATASLTVLTGTDQLEGATGAGDFVADPQPSLILSLD
ncbi:MAG: DUF3224 domain-containing protein [Mycobacteriales bacterium]